jgi:prepilin-type processing-associated H-X9-DG protein
MLAPTYGEVRWGSYAYNAFGTVGVHGLCGWFDPNATSVPPGVLVRETAVVAPADMIAVGDSPLSLWTDFMVCGEIDLDWQMGRIMAYNREPAQMLAAYRQRHHDRFNVGFCDGHAEFLGRLKLFSMTDASLRRWNCDHQPWTEDFMKQAWHGAGNDE